MLAPSQPANVTVTTSIINKCWRQVNPPMRWSQPLLINVCQHTVDESTIQSTRAGLGRHHLAFAVANCLWNQRFATATVGSCGDCWKLWRLLEATTSCQWGPQYDRKCSLFYLLFFLYNSKKPRSQTESCLFSSTDCCNEFYRHF